MKQACPHCGKPISPAVAASLLGSVSSPKKVEAARKNAKLGGWPTGRPRKFTPGEPVWLNREGDSCGAATVQRVSGNFVSVRFLNQTLIVKKSQLQKLQ